MASDLPIVSRNHFDNPGLIEFPICGEGESDHDDEGAFFVEDAFVQFDLLDTEVVNDDVLSFCNLDPEPDLGKLYISPQRNLGFDDADGADFPEPDLGKLYISPQRNLGFDDADGVDFPGLNDEDPDLDHAIINTTIDIPPMDPIDDDITIISIPRRRRLHSKTTDTDGIFNLRIASGSNSTSCSSGSSNMPKSPGDDAAKVTVAPTVLTSTMPTSGVAFSTFRNVVEDDQRKRVVIAKEDKAARTRARLAIDAVVAVAKERSSGITEWTFGDNGNDSIGIWPHDSHILKVSDAAGCAYCKVCGYFTTGANMSNASKLLDICGGMKKGNRSKLRLLELGILPIPGAKSPGPFNVLRARSKGSELGLMQSVCPFIGFSSDEGWGCIHLLHAAVATLGVFVRL